MYLRHLSLAVHLFSLALIVSCSLPSGPASLEAESTPVIGSISLMASNMFYVAADQNAGVEPNGVLVADRTTIGLWETFTVQHLDGGRIALKASNSLYVSADRNSGGLLVADRAEVGDWEQFELMRLSADLVALRSSNGNYVSADQNKGGMLVADRTMIGDWERFTLVRVGKLP